MHLGKSIPDASTVAVGTKPDRDRSVDENLDLSDHMGDAVKSLKIVLAADQSVRTGKVVAL